MRMTTTTPGGRARSGAGAGRRGAGGRWQPSAGRGRGRRRWRGGSPRLPRRRSRQVRTYSEGERRCCHGCGPRRPRRAAPAPRHHGRAPRGRGPGPARAGRSRSRRAGGRAGCAGPPRPADGGRRRGRAGRGRAGGPPPRRRGGAGGPGHRHALVVAARRDRARWAIPTRWSWSAPPGSWPSAGLGPPCPCWRRPRPSHADARCREAAVAALGAIGDPAGLPAVLAALRDTPTVRRRATVALAGFDDPRVDARAAGGGRRPGLAGAPGGRRVARRGPT